MCIRRILCLSVPLTVLLFSYAARAYDEQADGEKNHADKAYAKQTSAKQQRLTPFDVLSTKVWRTPYEKLPQYKVTAKRFGSKKKNENNHLYSAAKRTLNDSRNWLAEATEPKLFNANGICFKGKWIINQASPFSGAFKQGTHAQVIARASVVLSGTKQKDKRSFGMAIKVFDQSLSHSKNAFVIHSVAGVKTRAVRTLTLDNEPALKGLPPISQIRTLLRIDKDLKRADKATGTKQPKVNYRPLDGLARLATTDVLADITRAPTWMRLTPVSPPLTKANYVADDFRDELTLNKQQPTIEYRIEVAKGEVGKKKQAQWTEIGLLILNESVVSVGCDIHLHFTHPKRTI